MTLSRTWILVAVVLTLGWLGADQSWAQGQGWRGQGGGCGPRLMCQDRFTALDTNKDGQVDQAEFLSADHPGRNAEQVFKNRDTNSDGLLTQDEFCAGRGMHRGRGWQ